LKCISDPRPLLFSVAFLLLSCERPEIYSVACTMPCYTGPEGTRNVGACRDGMPRCEQDKVVACEGEQIPQVETCNGIDDNCNRVVDENVSESWRGRECGSSVGLCSMGVWMCISGTKTCGGDIEPHPELCNKRDDDCNGLVDDVAPTGACYTADAQTLLHAPCRPGVEVCVDGHYRCVGEVTPGIEVCDELDNDCNGYVDDGLSTDIIDVVFVVDRSCSMADEEFDRVKEILARVAVDFGDRYEYRFALVGLPTISRPVPELISDFVSGRDFLPVVAAFNALPSTSDEPSYDALRAIATDEFMLSRRAGARSLVVLWGDEPGQSYYSPPNTDGIIAYGLKDSGYAFLGFLPVNFHTGYALTASVTGGALYELTDAQTMHSNLSHYLILECL
jgi:hypothetical protein